MNNNYSGKVTFKIFGAYSETRKDKKIDGQIMDYHNFRYVECFCTDSMDQVLKVFDQFAIHKKSALLVADYGIYGSKFYNTKDSIKGMIVMYETYNGKTTITGLDYLVITKYGRFKMKTLSMNMSDIVKTIDEKLRSCPDTKVKIYAKHINSNSKPFEVLDSSKLKPGNHIYSFDDNWARVKEAV